jgi:hypothetical protein
MRYAKVDCNSLNADAKGLTLHSDCSDLSLSEIYCILQKNFEKRRYGFIFQFSVILELEAFQIISLHCCKILADTLLVVLDIRLLYR